MLFNRTKPKSLRGSNIRLHLHKCIFKSTCFQDKETASKTKLFQSVYYLTVFQVSEVHHVYSLRASQFHAKTPNRFRVNAVSLFQLFTWQIKPLDSVFKMTRFQFGAM